MIHKNNHYLKEETHERVGAVIASIVMAIGVIMFYFKGSFNFDTQEQSLSEKRFFE